MVGREERFQCINTTLAKDKIYHPVTRSYLFPLLDLHASIYVETAILLYVY